MLHKFFLLLLDHAQSCTFIVAAVARFREEGGGMKVRVPVTLAAAMATVLTVGLTACTGTASESSSGNSPTVPLLKVGLPWSQPTLDETKNINASWVNSLSLETLVRFGPQGQVEPNLATSVTEASPVTLAHPDASWQFVPAEINSEIFEQ